jgi:hypothetical protein
MKAISSLWLAQKPNSNQTAPVSIVVTTESQDVLNEIDKYRQTTLTANSPPFPFTFVLNRKDIMQGTGFFQNQQNVSWTADAALLSAMSSLQLQMMTRVTVGNCCSNFHLLLADLLSEGCGASPQNTFQCLQDHDDPNVRPCCSWDKSEMCQDRRRKRALISNS